MYQRSATSVLVLALAIGIVIVALCAGIWVKEDVATRALDSQGFTQVHILQKRWFLVGLTGCGRDDSAMFTAEAVNPIGKKVYVDVCAGILKGATLRY